VGAPNENKLKEEKRKAAARDNREFTEKPREN